MTMKLESRRRRYWRINLGLIQAAMLLGFVATFVVSFFARELDFVFLGWPFSFWVAPGGLAGLSLHRGGLRLDHEPARPARAGA